MVDAVMHLLALRTVFSNVKYVTLACGIFAVLFLALIYISEYLFVAPYLVLHVPDYEVLGFALVVLVSSLVALVTCMSVYRLVELKSGRKQSGSSFVGSAIGVSAGTCSSCGSIGLAIVSVFGTAGAAATAFLNEYEIPLRLLSIAILSCTYFFVAKSLTVECKIKRTDSTKT